ncbi:MULTISPECIES: hypothetical protein [unclassified Pseudomonas]|jgi:hypothetical protein|uniref:hypothetical protein n=1 Tax=unclassified Pseudomonas TaxID=196821 RepID=UPI001430AD91|nr:MULTISPECIES: hypothetical protein [unclassified Pseudomonas]MDY0835703.1 hypothetical protein [Pseudomonas sp. SED1]NIL18279.1 hypothetical protein [Pseudomonas sp. AN3A02]
MPRNPQVETNNALDDFDLDPVLISNLTPPPPGDTESAGGLGLRHVEHNLEVTLLRPDGIVVDTVIYLYWNNPYVPVDYLVIQPQHEKNRFFNLMVNKEQILPEWAEVYCTVERPSGNRSKTKPLKLRVKRSRPGEEDPNRDVEGHQGLVFFLPPDLDAGSHVDSARAEQGVVIEVQPYENMAEWDTCIIAWGSELVTHVVTAAEVRRAFEVTITAAVINEAPDDNYLPVAMQIMDVGGNYPGPNTNANWSQIQRVNVGLGVKRPYSPFLEQAGEIVNLEELGAAAQKVQIFVDNTFFEVGDRVMFHWEGRDIQTVPFFYSDEQPVNQTNIILEFEVPNELVSAIASGIAIMYYMLYKARDNTWLPSKKVRVRVIGEVTEWDAPTIVEAPNGVLDPTSSATMKFRAQDGWNSATKIRVVWVAHSVNYSDEFYLGPISEGQELSFVIPNEEVSRFNTLEVEVYYERVDLMPHRASMRLQLQVGEPTRTLLPVEVSGTSGNYLNPDDIGSHASVIVPAADTLEGDIITLMWDGDQVSKSFQVILNADQAGAALTIMIERSYVIGNLDGSVRIKYDLSRANVPRRFSQIRVLFIRIEFDHITDFRNSNTNGWTFGPALSDLRDRAFRDYGSFTTFYNYTYGVNNKNGVIFSQVFNNLHAGLTYMFSITVRRFDGRFTLPSLALRSSQGQVVGATEISNMNTWLTLEGSVVPSGTSLTLFIDSHQASADGNDYELREIRFRLV